MNATITTDNKLYEANTIMIMYIILVCFYSLILTCLCYRNCKPDPNITNSIRLEKFTKILSNMKKLKRVGFEPVLK